MEHDSDSAGNSAANSKNVSPQGSRRVSRSNSLTELSRVNLPDSGSETNVVAQTPLRLNDM